MLEGLLVDLVPIDARFLAREHGWENGPSAFWGDAGDRRFFSKSMITRHQEENAERRERGGASVGWGIQTKDGTPIGEIYVGQLDAHHRTSMLGAYLGEPQYWGGGYGTDALLLAVDYAFDWLDLRRVYLDTMSSNDRVIRQMAKVGFSLEARRREQTRGDGVWYDMLCYGLLCDEWPGYAAMVDRLGLRTPEAR